MTRKQWLAAGAALIIVLLMVAQWNRYELRASNNWSYRLDRLTGHVAVCSANTCATLTEQKAEPLSWEQPPAKAKDPNAVIWRGNTLPPAGVTAPPK